MRAIRKENLLDIQQHAFDIPEIKSVVIWPQVKSAEISSQIKSVEIWSQEKNQ